MVKKILILDTPGCASYKHAKELIVQIKKRRKIVFSHRALS